MALNLCNLDGIIRLATYIATTVTLVVGGKRRLLMLAPLSVHESFMETYDGDLR
jgi:predicted N-acetyltransferase YhbS